MGSLDRILRGVYRRLFRPDRLAALRKRGLVAGRNLVMLDGVIIDWNHCWHIAIGDDVVLAPRVHILAHDLSTKRYLGYTRIGRVTIGSRVFIGSSSVVLPGVTIGDDVIVGAASVVTHDIPSRTVAAGNPCRPICSLDDYLARRRAEMERLPRFSDAYTVGRNLTAAMKAEMNDRMTERFGYVI